MTTPYIGQPGGTGPWPLQGLPLPAAAGPGNWQLAATTGLAGFALQDATPVILGPWTAPADGNLHRFTVALMLHVTSALTGGGINVDLSAPDGTAVSGYSLESVDSVGVHPSASPVIFLIEPGSSVELVQAAAVTAGAATLWAEIWGC